MSLPCVTAKPNLIIDFAQGIRKVSMQRYSSTTCMLVIERDTGTSMVPLRDCIFSQSLAGSRPTRHQVRRMVPAQTTLFYKMPLVGCPLCRVVNQLCDIVELRLREEKQSVQPRGEASNPYISDKMQSRKEAKTSPILATAKEVGPGESCVTIEENQCVVCLTAECEIEFTTCGHRILCKPCLKSFLESKGIRTKKFNDVTTYDMKRALEWDGWYLYFCEKLIAWFILSMLKSHVVARHFSFIIQATRTVVVKKATRLCLKALN